MDNKDIEFINLSNTHLGNNSKNINDSIKNNNIQNSISLNNLHNLHNTQNYKNLNIYGSIILIDINKVQINKNQPRRIFDDKKIDELAISINNIGIINPIIVIPKGQFYEIISGERRFRAARKLKLKKIPILIKSYDKLEALEVSLIDNIQRENLNPIEEALTYKKMQEIFNLSQEQIAIKVGKNRVTIANCMRLLKLDSRVQSLIIQRELSQGHARALLFISNNKLQFELAEKVIQQDLSVRQTENLAKKIVEQINNTKHFSNYNPKQPNFLNTANNLNSLNKESENFYINISNQLNEILGTKVTIKEIKQIKQINSSSGKSIPKKSKGKIEIEYYSENDLERIICLFKKIYN